MKNEASIPDVNTIRDDTDALDQSIALNRIVMTLLTAQKENNKRLFIALVVSLLMNAFIVAGFLWYESQWEYVTTSTETVETTQSVEGDNAQINNVEGNQYNDNSVHKEGGIE